MNAIDLLKSQIQMSHNFLDGTFADVTQEQADALPGGRAHPIGATYAHLLLAEDVILSMMVRGTQPLVMSTYAGKAGVSEPPPMGGSAEDTFAWANRVKVDLGQAKEYGHAVMKNTLEWLDTLSETDLDRELEPPGFGKQTVASMISLAAVVHGSNHCGEISALKGLQGAKGYPF
jgi:uncharacterized damage-inducible protein DinB